MGDRPAVLLERRELQEGVHVLSRKSGSLAPALWIASTLLALSVGAPGSADELPSAPAPTLQELGDAHYRGIEMAGGPVTLVGGRWEGEPYARDAASRPAVELLGDFRLLGDLDADGAEEAVVLLAARAGGSGEYLYLAVVERGKAGLENVATTLVGDRVQVRDARAEGSRIRIDVVRAGSDDAACCPGELASLGWELAPDGLRELPDSLVTGRLELATLAGKEWVLRSWDRGEAAPPEPEVTLAFRTGSFVGSAGCNRYWAAARPGATAGSVSVARADTSRMTCPEPAMAVETRFLRQLGDVAKFGFLAGRLVLSYQTDGVPGVMSLESR